MMDIEKLTDEDLARIQKKYGLLAEKTKEDLKKVSLILTLMTLTHPQ